MKLHIGVDTGGLPHAMFASTADMTDRDGARNLIGYAYPHLSKVRKVLVDGGYTGADFAEDVRWLIGAEVEVVKRNELHTFQVMPKRWIVERTFAWLDHCRRLWKNCERQLHTSLQMAKFAFISLLLKRC
jgi:transposase